MTDSNAPAASALEVLSGVPDTARLLAAGIRSVSDYASVPLAVAMRATRQGARAVKLGQRAARIYLRSGLDPALCRRLVAAGAKNACALLSFRAGRVVRKKAEREALETAKTAIAVDNVQRFVKRPEGADRDGVLAALGALKAPGRVAALETVRRLAGTTGYRWLSRALGSPELGALEPAALREAFGALPEARVEGALERLRDVAAPQAERRPAKRATGAPGGSVRAVQGIGKRAASRLAGAGIDTLADLVGMEVSRVHARSRLDPLRLYKWRSAAAMMGVGYVDAQIAEALVEGGFRDVESLARADHMAIYAAVQAARTPASARNRIPDSYARSFTPQIALELRRDAYRRCWGAGLGAPPAPGVRRPRLVLAPVTSWQGADESNYGPTTGIRSVSFIVLHAMAGSLSGTLREFQTPGTKKSAHYLVGRDGSVVQTVFDDDVAFHAHNDGGVSCTGLSAVACSGTRATGTWSSTPCNCESLGIELEDGGRYESDPRWATPELYRAAALLVADLCNRHGVPATFVGGTTAPAGVLGHEHVVNRTPGKRDPGPYFDWRAFMDLVHGDPQPPEPPPDPEPEDGGGGGSS